MGAGAFGAGSSPAGAYTPSASNATAATAPWALKLDPLSRDFVLDDDGLYIAVHPVEHRAMMLLIPAIDSIRSAQGQGGRWRDMEFADEATMTARFSEMVREAWRDLLTAGDVKLLRTRARPMNPWGRGRFEIDWMNLRDPQSPNRTTSL
jgi:hypothetical protein